jgi:hypothetical protein
VKRPAVVATYLVATFLAAACTARQAHGKGLDCAAPDDVGYANTPRVLEPTVTAGAMAPTPGGITIAMLPDVQYYTKCRSPHLAAQLSWLADAMSQRGVRAALYMGDLTEHNTRDEWRWFRDQIEPFQDRLPILLATGNHDYGHNGDAHRRHTLFDNYFRAPPGVAAASLAEDKRGSIENAYYRIDLPRVTLGVLVLEWAPRASTVAWASSVLSQYAHDRVIVVTHAYLYEDSTRYDWHTRGTAQRWNPLWYDMSWLEALHDREYDGEMLWQALVRRHPGIFLVLCGHVGGTGTGLLESRGDAGNLVQQVLANFQLLNEGGLGYLRLFEIQPDGRSMRMETYSPSLGRFAIADSQRAILPIEPALW